MHRTGLRRLASLHQRHPWVSVVLALHERPRADLAEIVQVGACDLVPLHADGADLQQALTRAIRITRARLGVPGGAGGGRGRVVTISSASGGCGKTFLATNAAAFLARATAAPVVLVDLDLQFGEVSTALRLRPEATISDALAAEAAGADLNEILDDYLLPHPDGFKVLAAPRLPAEADSITPGDVTRLLDVLRARRAWVVVDTHEGVSRRVRGRPGGHRPRLRRGHPRPAQPRQPRSVPGHPRPARDGPRRRLHRPQQGRSRHRARRRRDGRPARPAFKPSSPTPATSPGPSTSASPSSPANRSPRSPPGWPRPCRPSCPGRPKPGPAPHRAPATVIPIRVAMPIAAPVPEPGPAVVTPAAAEDPDRSDTPVEIDLSVPRPPPCRSAAPARPTGRRPTGNCRRSPCRPGGRPLGRGRAPPSERYRPTRPAH